MKPTGSSSPGDGPAPGRSYPVSVVIPAYNSEAYLGRALASVLAQTFRPAEVVVVDDGSTDSTRELAERFDPLVRCVSQPNQGPSAARNRGVQESTAELVAFLDSDDEWTPAFLARTAGPMAEDPGIGMCYCLTERVEPDGSRLLESDPRRDRMTPWGVYPPPFSHVSASVFRKEALVKAGGFDVSFACYEDFDLFVRVGELSRVSLVEDVLVRRRVRSGSLSETTSVETAVETLIRLVCKTIGRRGGGASREAVLADAMLRAGELYFGAWRTASARRYFAAGFSLHPSAKAARFLFKTFLPSAVIRAVRWMRSRTKG
jgi:glycosyltransferase involved in cell wall biosynthesis